MVEKPTPAAAPSDLAIIGRYILTPEVFSCLEDLPPGSGGEIQLTDALRKVLDTGDVYGLLFEGTRYDAGSKIGFLKATVDFALQSGALARIRLLEKCRGICLLRGRYRAQGAVAAFPICFQK